MVKATGVSGWLYPIVSAPERGSVGSRPHVREHVEIPAPRRVVDVRSDVQAEQPDADRLPWAPELDVLASVRDRTAALRDALLQEAKSNDSPEVGRRAAAARDRAAAALDRYEAALDRHRAASYLRAIYRDRLTGALHRDAGEDRLRAEVDRCRRQGSPLVIAFVDVDGLKQVNAERGHDGGDALLRAVGSALRSRLRSYDLVVRYGGDEFVCAFSGTHLPEVRQRMADVQDVLSREMPGATISVGLAERHAHEELEAVIHRADRDLFAGRRRAAAVSAE